MTDDAQTPKATTPPETIEEFGTDPRPELPPEAVRALAEAAERRKKVDAKAGDMPTEHGGRLKGLEPVRYGDWEKKGLAIDF